MLQEQERRWVPLALAAVFAAILVSHVLPWLDSHRISQRLLTQQRVLGQLLQYERLLGQFDENLRGVMMAPERPELAVKKKEIIAEMRRQLERLVETGPSEGEFVPVLVSLAAHFKKQILPEAAQVEIQAKAPGDWALQRFRSDYADVRSEHLKQVAELTNQARALAEDAFALGRRRLVLSAGVCLLSWSLVLAVLVGQGRLRARLASAMAHPVVGPPSRDTHDSHASPLAPELHIHEAVVATSDSEHVPVVASVASSHAPAQDLVVETAAAEVPVPPPPAVVVPLQSAAIPTPTPALMPTARVEVAEAAPVTTPVVPPVLVAAPAVVTSQDDIAALLASAAVGSEAPAAAITSPAPVDTASPTEAVLTPRTATAAAAPASEPAVPVEPPRTIRAATIAPNSGAVPAGPLDLSF